MIERAMKKTARNKRDFWLFKAPVELKKELDRIRLGRIKKGKDIEFQSYQRLGLAISRHSKLFDDLLNADLKEEDKNDIKKNK